MQEYENNQIQKKKKEANISIFEINILQTCIN